MNTHDEVNIDDRLGNHPTEKNRPKQCSFWLDFDNKAYIVHLDKNADYSPMNILGTGELGCVVRLWDKIARLMNLYGFDITTGKFVGGKKPHVKDESIDDTICDLRNYAQILFLVRHDAWGK